MNKSKPKATPKPLHKIGSEELNKIFETAKAAGDTTTMLQCTQIALLSELKKEMTSQLKEIAAGYRTISEALADCSMGIEIYPKSSEEGD